MKTLLRKISLLLVLLITSVFVLTACTDGGCYDGGDRNWDPIRGTKVTSQCIRTDGTPDEPQNIVVIESEEKLAEYYLENQDKYSFGAQSNSASFTKAIEKYNAEYFKDKLLVFVVLEETSGSIRHQVISVEFLSYSDNANNTIHIERTVPEVLTDDMAVWHIIIDCLQINVSRLF